MCNKNMAKQKNTQRTGNNYHICNADRDIRPTLHGEDGVK